MERSLEVFSVPPAIENSMKFLLLRTVYRKQSLVAPDLRYTVEPPLSDHLKCKGLVVAYESRIGEGAKLLGQS